MARRNNVTAIDADYNPAIDTGCEFAPACLSCPFPTCRYDHPRGVLGMMTEHRRVQARELKDAGVPIPTIAQALGVSIRAIYRDLALVA